MMFRCGEMGGRFGVKDWYGLDVLGWSRVFFEGRGKAKHDLLQKDEIEVFMCILGYKRKVTGVVLIGIKDSGNLQNMLYPRQK